MKQLRWAYYQYRPFFKKGFASARSFISALSILSVIVALLNVPKSEWLGAILHAYKETVSEPLAAALRFLGIHLGSIAIDLAVLYFVVATISLYLALRLSVHLRRTPYDGPFGGLGTPDFVLNPLFNSAWLIGPFLILFTLFWPIGMAFLMSRPYVFSSSNYQFEEGKTPYRHRLFLGRDRKDSCGASYNYDLRLAFLSTAAALSALVLLTLLINGITD
jgi:hypothetical protein